VVASKNSLAILSCVVLEVRNNNTILFTASDGSQWLSTKATIEETDIEAGTKFCIEAKDLKQALANLAGRAVEITFDNASSTMTCTFASGKFSLPYKDADEFPSSAPMGEGKTEYLLDAPTVAKMIEQSDYAMANDPLRLVMNGLYFDFLKDGLSLVASDGHKLALCQDKTTKSETPCSFILMAQSAKVLSSLIAKEEGQIKIAFDGRNVCINNRNFKLTAKLIEGRFPNYNAVIPKESSIKVKVNKDDLTSALKRIIPMSSTATELVRMEFTPNLLNVTCEDVDYSKSASETIQCDFGDAQPFAIGFKGSALKQSIQAIGGDNVVMEMESASRAVIIRSTENEQDYTHIALIMPMLLND
jgi:DNA polymerase-3 subunit beta